jgi:hypothetical protein
MAVAYASAGAGNGTETSGAQLQLTCPATVAANDVLIAHVTHLDITSSPTAPANWDLLYGPANLGTGTAVGRSWVYGKLAVGNEDGVTLDWGNPAVGSGRYGRIYSFSGYSSGVLADLVGGFSDTPTEGTIPLPTVTTSIAGALAVALLTQDDNNSFAAAGAVTGGTWAEPVAEFVSTTIGAQGCVTGIQTCTPTADPGTVTGGTANATADEGSTIGFEIRAEPPPVPRFGAAGTQLQGSASTMNVAVPSGVAADDIVVVTAFVDTSTVTVTGLPSGFAQAPDSPVFCDTGGVGGAHRLYVMWKRATGADSGTYDFTLSASDYRNAQAIRYVGAVTSGDPWNVTNSAQGGATSDTVTPAVSDTSTADDVLWVWAGTNWAGGTWTPPTNYTERRDSGDGVCTVADRNQVAAGSSGSITGTCTGNDKRTAWLGALMSVAAGGVTGTASGDYTFTATSSGVPETFGTAASAFTFGSTAAGVPDVQGTAAGAYTFTATAIGQSGTPPVEGQAQGAYTFGATAAGVPETFGTAISSGGFTATAAGVDRAVGAAQAPLAFGASGSGRPRSIGSAATSAGFTATAAGVPDVHGTAAIGLSFTATANGFAGSPPVTGQGAGVYTFGSTASGIDRAIGTAASAFTLTSTAAGIPDVHGTALAPFTVTATAIGQRKTSAQAAAALAFMAAAGGFSGHRVTPDERIHPIPAVSRTYEIAMLPRALEVMADPRTLTVPVD